MASAKLYDVDGAGTPLNEPTLENEQSVGSYVLSKVQEWEDHYESNYQYKHEEYTRLWRGEWDEEDRTRGSERSRIVTPALAQAVEDAVADIEEATFAHGKLFDIKDDLADPDPLDVAMLRQKLTEDFKKQKIRKEVCDVLINAAVTGTGIAEVVLDEVQESAPATQPVMDGQMQAIGVNIVDRVVVKMRSIQPRNFRVDPNARSIEEAHGVAIDEFVPMHIVQELQANGTYNQGDVGLAPQDLNIEVDPEIDTLSYHDKVRVTKYFGLVPRHLLDKARGIVDEDEDIVDLVEPLEVEEGTEESYWVEAIVVIANEGECILKAEENPFMMKDRPVVAFQWDITPGVFWGRGICEKGYNTQKALDAEIRARIDALALTVHPMLAMDATRIPRGHKPEVRPGKMILTNGNPSDVLVPFNFGSVDQITFAQADALQNMLRQATGTLDGATLSNLGSNNKTGAVSMAIGGMLKRQKRTLIHFEDQFWVPFIEKAAWRYMQFDPENYPVKDFKFLATGNLGTMQSEYEVSQLTQLLQTMGDQSPLYAPLVEAIVGHMNISNREELVKKLKDAAKPDPEAIKKKQMMEQEAHQMQLAMQKAQISAVGGQAAESNARAQKYKVEASLEPRKVENDRIDAVADVRDGVTEKEFQRRLKIAETRLKEKELNIKEMDIKERRKNEKEAQRMINSTD
jgi:hypothetical protein